MTASLAAKSDQLNAVDLPRPQIFTIESVTAGSPDQPFNFHLVEAPGRPYRPSKGMRRVLARGWGGTDVEKVYPGRRLTLWCNPEVKWAGAPVGGIQISAMSDLDGPFTMPLRLSQKQTTTYTVQPLVEQQRPAPQPDPSPDEIAACTDRDTLLSWHRSASPEAQALIVARGKQLAGGAS